MSRFFNGDNVNGHLIRTAISGACIRGHSFSNARICGSNASATDPRAERWYFGGGSRAGRAGMVTGGGGGSGWAAPGRSPGTQPAYRLTGQCIGIAAVDFAAFQPAVI